MATPADTPLEPPATRHVNRFAGMLLGLTPIAAVYAALQNAWVPAALELVAAAIAACVFHATRRRIKHHALTAATTEPASGQPAATGRAASDPFPQPGLAPCPPGDRSRREGTGHRAV